MGLFRNLQYTFVLAACYSIFVNHNLKFLESFLCSDSVSKALAAPHKRSCSSFCPSLQQPSLSASLKQNEDAHIRHDHDRDLLHHASGRHLYHLPFWGSFDSIFRSLVPFRHRRNLHQYRCLRNQRTIPKMIRRLVEARGRYNTLVDRICQLILQNYRSRCGMSDNMAYLSISSCPYPRCLPHPQPIVTVAAIANSDLVHLVPHVV